MIDSRHHHRQLQRAGGPRARASSRSRAPPPARPHEIVVVDNASTDGSAGAGARPLAGRAGDRRSAETSGFAAANNVGIRATRGELRAAAQQRHDRAAGRDRRAWSRALRARPDAAVAGPRLVDADGRPELSFGPMIAPARPSCGRRRSCAALRAGGSARSAAHRSAADDAARGATGSAARACSCGAPTRRPSGLLDERFFMYTEDVDFCAAIRARGRRVLFTPAVEVVHLRGRSARAPTRRRPAAAYRRSQLAFYEKHHPALGAGCCAAYLRLRGPDAAGREPMADFTVSLRRAHRASTPGSCTTSASAPTSGTCCGSWRGSTSETEYVAALPAATTATALARARRELPRRRRSAPATTRSREQVSDPAGAAARARRPLPRAALRAAAARARAGRS